MGAGKDPWKKLMEAAEHLGRQAAEKMLLEAAERDADEEALEEWADDWFSNQGDFDMLPGEVPLDQKKRKALKQAFVNAFIEAMRARLAAGGAG